MLYLRSTPRRAIREGMQIVVQSEDEPIAPMHAERGSFAAIAGGVAVTDLPMIQEIAVCNVHLERAISAAQILWLGDFGTGSGTRTDGVMKSGLRGSCGGSGPGIYARAARFPSLTRANRCLLF